MPGTLIPPTPESSIESIPPISKQEFESPVLDVTPPLSEDEGGSLVPEFAKQGPLSRTMSDMERDIFVSRLSQDAPALVYVIPQADAEHIVAQAIALKFNVYVSMQEDKGDENALLILGKNEKAVQDIVNTIRKSDSEVAENKAAPAHTSTPSPSVFRAVAGGALVGAVGTWAGLAFS